jgi:hypothetical protein
MRLWGWLRQKGGTDSTVAAPGGASPLVIDLVAETIPTTALESVLHGDGADSASPSPSGTLAPPVTKFPILATEKHPAPVHARRLLAWLQAPGEAGLHNGLRQSVPILHSRLLRIYTEMLGELNWEPVPWNTVAQHFTALLPDARKTYAWVVDENRHRSRLRVYQIPPPPLNPVDTAPMPLAAVVGLDVRRALKTPAPSSAARPSARARQKRVA